MSRKENLTKAKNAKADEFYTSREAVEDELSKYSEHFKGKVIYLNCDDVTGHPLVKEKVKKCLLEKGFSEDEIESKIDFKTSEFFNYFIKYNRFKNLGLKKLIATHFNRNGISFKVEVNGDLNGDGIIDENDVEVFLLEDSKGEPSNGDFNDNASREILFNEADIVITNPPFSLFRNYIDLLIESGKKFLIMGNNNAITYKNVFGYIKENKVWLGTKSNQSQKFEIPDHYEVRSEKAKCKLKRFIPDPNNPDKELQIEVNGLVVQSISWFTNMEHEVRNGFLDLKAEYERGLKEGLYPKYDNYDAINIDKIAEIPKDYYGIMGVPITFLGKYNPEQFEIVRFRKGNDGKDLRLLINGLKKEPYFRILIKRKQKEGED